MSTVLLNHLDHDRAALGETLLLLVVSHQDVGHANGERRSSAVAFNVSSL
jgi:hypothetical protein